MKTFNILTLSLALGIFQRKKRYTLIRIGSDLKMVLVDLAFPCPSLAFRLRYTPSYISIYSSVIQQNFSANYKPLHRESSTIPCMDEYDQTQKIGYPPGISTLHIDFWGGVYIIQNMIVDLQYIYTSYGEHVDNIIPSYRGRPGGVPPYIDTHKYFVEQLAIVKTWLSHIPGPQVYLGDRYNIAK